MTMTSTRPARMGFRERSDLVMAYVDRLDEGDCVRIEEVAVETGLSEKQVAGAAKYLECEYDAVWHLPDSQAIQLRPGAAARYADSSTRNHSPLWP